MPVSAQKLFTNAPMSLSPQISLLVFVMACVTLCIISVNVIYQVRRVLWYWYTVYRARVLFRYLLSYKNVMLS